MQVSRGETKLDGLRRRFDPTEANGSGVFTVHAWRKSAATGRVTCVKPKQRGGMETASAGRESLKTSPSSFNHARGFVGR